MNVYLLCLSLQVSLLMIISTFKNQEKKGKQALESYLAAPVQPTSCKAVTP